YRFHLEINTKQERDGRFLLLFPQRFRGVSRPFVNSLSMLHLDILAYLNVNRLPRTSYFHHIFPLTYLKRMENMAQTTFRVHEHTVKTLSPPHAPANYNDLAPHQHIRLDLLQLTVPEKNSTHQLHESSLFPLTLVMHRQLHISAYVHQENECKINQLNLISSVPFIILLLVFKIP